MIKAAIDTLRLNVLKQEMQVPESQYPEEYFVIPKCILESYIESRF